MVSLRNYSLVRFLGIAFLGLVAASGQVYAATAVVVDETNLELLQGRWEGTTVNKNLDGQYGQTPKRKSVILEITGESDLNSSSLVVGGKPKKSKVVVEDGKIKILFNQKLRDFVLERLDDGSLRLSAKFRLKKSGGGAGGGAVKGALKLFEHRVVLDKAGS